MLPLPEEQLRGNKLLIVSKEQKFSGDLKSVP